MRWVVGFVDVVVVVNDVAFGTDVDVVAAIAPMGIVVMGTTSLLAHFSYTSLSISISISLS